MTPALIMTGVGHKALCVWLADRVGSVWFSRIATFTLDFWEKTFYPVLWSGGIARDQVPYQKWDPGGSTWQNRFGSQKRSRQTVNQGELGTHRVPISSSGVGELDIVCLWGLYSSEKKYLRNFFPSEPFCVWYFWRNRGYRGMTFSLRWRNA